MSKDKFPESMENVQDAKKVILTKKTVVFALKSCEKLLKLSSS